MEVEQITQVLAAHTAKAKLLRLDKRPDLVKAAFLVEFQQLADLHATRAALRGLSEARERGQRPAQGADSLVRRAVRQPNARI